MAGIAGIERKAARTDVQRMLDQIAYRGPAGREIIETNTATLGLVFAASEFQAAEDLRQRNLARDGVGHGRLAEACLAGDRLTLTRDALGVAPLYFGRLADGTLCYASEVKALLGLTRDVYELPPGCVFDGLQVEEYFRLEQQPPMHASPSRMARELRGRLAAAVERRVGNGEVGSWLSGGLDSSVLAALARPHVERLHTFVAGMDGAPDLGYAAEVAAFVGSHHHEIVVTLAQMLAVLPAVIYHLESFDALLVRSSITNYLVAQAAADFVPAALSGEGSDELFAGYEYLKALDPSALPDELIDITGRLHNTALQRVDRCASAHGTVAHVAFLDPEVAAYAMQIPAEFKQRDGCEKWILRRALDGALPESVLNRTKAKFWDGAGVGDLLAQHADEKISDAGFQAERTLPNGWTLNTKEELFYYRIFREHFGEMDNLAWMGRTKNVPVWPNASPNQAQ
jgi:asparagine synthase (glutamine-hydrolysing)